MSKNPFATRDGGPKKGKTAEWDAWEQAAEAQRRAALTPEQRQQEDDNRRQIGRRMQAESDFS
ncbi:hypothetical protein A6C57_00215 [Fibrella sp. ES10-3-2-2]|nr:hypothetical protein A6C57_00215 [Fibrella sp. ES10-3-2-2]